MNNEDETKKIKTNNLVKNIIIVVVFLVIGVAIGAYGTNKYLEYKSEDDNVDNSTTWPMDITSKNDYSELLEELYATVQGNPIFYTTGGITYNIMENNQKLSYIYNKLVAKSIGETATLPSYYYGSTTCENGFLVDSSTDASTISNTCTIVNISKSEFNKVAKDLFNDDSVDLSGGFSPVDGKSCIPNGESYMCGNVAAYSNISGDLESKFEILKVTKDKDDTIKIYDKGYLVDRRSNIINPNDGYANYYLHSSDSTEYYHELKSADNLTFVHIFKKNENGKYYYVSSALHKE